MRLATLNKVEADKEEGRVTDWEWVTMETEDRDVVWEDGGLLSESYVVMTDESLCSKTGQHPAKGHDFRQV